jgi:hypothetical protein
MKTALIITAVALGGIYFSQPIDWLATQTNCEVGDYLDSWPAEPQETCA